MNRDWHDLIQRHMAGLTTDTEAARLQDALRHDDDVARLYLRYMNLDVALEAKAASAEATRESPTASGSQEKRRSFGWLSWRPLTAAAAGIVFGMFCTSVVFGFGGQRPVVKKTPLAVYNPGFEGAKPLDQGLPHGADEWGVKSARRVAAEEGVTPSQGQHMLRMEMVLMNENDDNLSAKAYQVIDPRSLLLSSDSTALEVEVAASFYNPSEAKGSYLLRAVALNEPPATATENFWSKAEYAGVVSMTRRFEATSADENWQVVSMKMPLPRDAQSLVIILAAIAPKGAADQTNVRYLDDVQVSILTSSSSMSR